MEPLILAVTAILLTVNVIGAAELRMAPNGPLPVQRIRKREAPKPPEVPHNVKGNAEFIQFVEERLIVQSQALEHLMESVRKNEDLTKVLIDNIVNISSKPELPEPIEGKTRRAFDMSGPNKLQLKVQGPADEISPWCPVAVSCPKTNKAVCGFDDNFGFGKFEDICHMLQVNCYFKYSFSLSPRCTLH